MKEVKEQVVKIDKTNVFGRGKISAKILNFEHSLHYDREK